MHCPHLWGQQYVTLKCQLISAAFLSSHCDCCDHNVYEYLLMTLKFTVLVPVVKNVVNWFLYQQQKSG